MGGVIVHVCVEGLRLRTMEGRTSNYCFWYRLVITRGNHTPGSHIAHKLARSGSCFYLFCSELYVQHISYVDSYPAAFGTQTSLWKRPRKFMYVQTSITVTRWWSK